MPNVDQVDTDHDGIGDACDATTINAGDVIADATSPAGAIVPYAVTATETGHADPVVACAPAAGGLFAIGTTTVTCTAKDAGGNTATASFGVTVLGAKDQLTNLTREVVESTALPPRSRGV